jgi:hypothetical protein
VKQIDFKPKYIKIDVDGNELLILRGMRETLKNRICKSLLVEIDESNEIEKKECLDILNSYNYKIISKKRIYKNSSSVNYIFEH